MIQNYCFCFTSIRSRIQIPILFHEIICTEFRMFFVSSKQAKSGRNGRHFGMFLIPGSNFLKEKCSIQSKLFRAWPHPPRGRGQAGNHPVVGDPGIFFLLVQVTLLGEKAICLHCDHRRMVLILLFSLNYKLARLAVD
jgi:hypothetical protein